jgi:hypothetical protein
MPVPRNAGGVIGALVMVSSGARCIESINDISALEVLLSKMRSTVSNLFVFADRIEWSVGHVSRVSLLKRAAACQALALGLDWSWVARSARTAFVQGAEGLRAVARVRRMLRVA